MDNLNQRKKRLYTSSEYAITLIALIVTIIVLLVLAGITINLAVGNQGIFNKAKAGARAYKTEEVKEKLNLYLADYQAEKAQNKDLKLIDYLQKQNEIDDVTDNEDGTLTVIVGDYITTVKDDGTGIESIYKGVAPKVEYALYSDAEGKNIVNSSTMYDNIYIGVKITNASELSATPKIVLTDPSESEVSSTNVAEFNGYFEATKKGTYSLKVSGVKKQLIKISNINGVLPGTTLRESQAKKINQEGLIYADLDGDPTTAEALVVASGNLESIPTSMPTGYEIKDYVGEGKTSKGKIITKSSTTNGNQFYVLSLVNYDTSTYALYKARDIKIENWSVPSKDEWNAFMTNLKNQGLTTTNYNSSFGLDDIYCCSSKYSIDYYWRANFSSGIMDTQYDQYNYSVRLCTTF